MTMTDPLDEQKAVRMRQRLWGAAVLIALLVIFLPLLLDGSGSESQYRRVERLRAEPPRVINENGVPEAVEQIVKPVANETAPGDSRETTVVDTQADALSTQTTQSATNRQSIPASQAQAERASAGTSPSSAEPLSAWVVQAGSFGDEANALAVRDKLRRAGFPSFVTPTDAVTPMFRVRVGPMINLPQAEVSRNKVMRLLDREAIVVSYP